MPELTDIRREEVPEPALSASLGCGVPTARGDKTACCGADHAAGACGCGS